MALSNKNGGDLPSDLAVTQSVSLENASDSERAEKEIDRIIAEAFMLEPHCSGTALPSFPDAVVPGESGGSHTEFEDEDPETLCMRLSLIESLQNKLKSVEKEDGEVSDEDVLTSAQISSPHSNSGTSSKAKRDTEPSTRKRARKRDDSKTREKHRSSEKRSSGRATENGRHYSTPRTYLNSGRSSRSTVSGSKSREQDRKSKASSTTCSNHSRRSRKSERDSTKRKNEATALKQPVTELSITLPVEHCSTDASDVVVTTGKDIPKITAERVVDTSRSTTSGENRCIKRVGDSGPHLSITVNTFTGASSGTERAEVPPRPIIERIHLPEDAHFSQNSTSTPRPSPRLPRRNFASEMLGVDPDIPLPPPPLPPRPVPVSPTSDKDFVLLPPPPAPPVFPQAMGMMEKCTPSSITVQVREGGGRVAQLSSSTRVSEASASTQKRAEISSIRQPEPPPPPPITTEQFPDNYEDVGMDVESSRSSCISDYGNGDSAGADSPRHRLLSESDEAQLREMLLSQVHKKRLAESAAQSSNASVCDGHPEEEATQNPSSCSNEDEKNPDVKNVLPQARSEECVARTVNGSEGCRAPAVNNNTVEKRHKSNSGRDRCESFEGPSKKKKLDDSCVSEEYYSLKSPPCTNLSALESMLIENQCRLNELDSQISLRMSSLNRSLLRRAEIRKQLEEIEADIDAERAGCRLLMQRRNSIRREVERYEECKLDLLLEAEWRPSENSAEVTRKSEGYSPLEREGSSAQSGGSSTRPSEEASSQDHVLSHEEEQMRLKLLAKMKRGVSVPAHQEPDEQDQATPFGSVEESCNQSTQTQASEEVIDEKPVPLYRLDSFPERLKRFVGVPPEMSVMTTDCPSEIIGEKCTDVFCKSAHGKDEELSPEEVLSMMISYAPGLVDSGDGSDLPSQVDVLKAKRLPYERFGLFARRLLDELPTDKRPASRRNSREQCTDCHANFIESVDRSRHLSLKSRNGPAFQDAWMRVSSWANNDEMWVGSSSGLVPDEKKILSLDNF